MESTRAVLTITESALAVGYIAELDGEALRAGWHDYEFWSALNGSKSAEERLALIADLGITHFITDETDQFEMLSVVERVAEPIAKFDPITVWKTRKVIRVSEELLSNNDFADGTEGWSGHAEHRSEFGSVMVSGDHSLSQLTPVDDEKTYVLEVRARCGPESASLRLQANWIGGDGAMISPAIAVRKCRPEFTREVFQIDPPERAEYAIVYANSHTSSYVEIDSVSLRRGIVNDQ